MLAIERESCLCCFPPIPHIVSGQKQSRWRSAARNPPDYGPAGRSRVALNSHTPTTPFCGYGLKPLAITTGTDNEELLGSPFYVGARHRRVRGEDYRDLLEETLEASPI